MRPPPRRDEARVAAGSRSQNKADDDSANPRTGRPTHQGKSAPARNACQRPPQWEPPAGWPAAELLEALWGPPRRRR
jgi:hypothetical protein